MKKIQNHLVGVDQGNVTLFSDFQDGGDMWIGSGSRERRKLVTFSEPFRKKPAVQVSVSMWDMDNQRILRGDLSAENIETTGFYLVFRTWGDSRLARLRASWMAIGELAFEDDWSVF